MIIVSGKLGGQRTAALEGGTCRAKAWLYLLAIIPDGFSFAF
jgi:hypothetical protein